MPVISVLWGLGLLSAIALSMLWSGTVAHGLARNSMEAVHVAAAAEAAVSRAVLGLFDPRPERRWRSDGIPQSFSFEGMAINVSVQDELGRIDINQAEASVLVGLFKSAGLDLNAATGLADKILDWRTSTALKHLNGAKEADYAAAGRAYRPRNGPFQSVDELLLVMGMTSELLRRIEPAVTVYSGRQFVDPQTAPREVLLSLPSMTPENVEAALAARARQAVPVEPPSVDRISSLRGRAFRIRTQIERPTRTYVYEAAVRLTDNPAEPYWLLSWRAR
jgi:general secretion pathway protein K